MRVLRADLHIHTCLSPCAQREMVPTAIVKRAKAAGLDMIGICDHNSAENAGATMEDLSLHILDIVENSLAAGASRIEIRITEDTRQDLLALEISDNGKGMDPETARRTLDPFFTTRTTRKVGLGLPLLAQAAEQAGGRLEVVSGPGRGTTVRAEFRLSHPDMKPLGDVAETLRAILAGRPGLSLCFEHRRDSKLVGKLSSDPHERS